MTKYKLEYIWLDGYEPVPNLRSKTKIVEFADEPTLEELPIWGFDGSSTRQAEGIELGLPAAAGRPSSRIRRARTACSSCARCCCRTARRTRRTAGRRSRTIPDTWFGFEQEYFLYQDGVPLGFPRGGLPGAAGRVLHGRRLQERRRRRARDRRRAHRPLPRGRHQPRGHQRRGRQGPVGVPDLRQGLEAGRRRGVDRPLPPAAPLRALPRRRELPPEAARHGARLERLRHAHELLDRGTCARSAARSTSRR